MRTLIDDFLTEQQRLQTPVARFAAAHDAEPALAPVYRDLIPLSAPGSGEQYAFEVDLDACSGCKACVSGCHALNGLDADETWRDVGLVLGGDAAHPLQQTITSACHHCAEPGCLEGCPVLAYDKDPVTGIVRHLDDQCIGCGYCVLKCPYDVPKYSPRLGIVRKCDMCHERLSGGEAPACVQACPTHAIRIVTVPLARDGAHARADTSAFLSVAPDPSYTQPTTRYVTRRALPDNLRAADAGALRPQPAHWPLIALLVATQAGYGVLIGGAMAAAMGVDRAVSPVPPVPTIAGLVLVAAGVIASVAHLGQPLRAWRVFLGLRTSWLSREAVALGASAMALGASLAHAWAFGAAGVAGTAGAAGDASGWMTGGAPPGWAGPWLGEVAGGWPALTPAAATSPGWILGLALGVVAVACSIMVYVDTRRRSWRLSVSATRMGGTVAVAALACVAPAVAAVAAAGKLAAEALSVRGDGVSARLQRGPLRAAVVARMALGVAAASLLAAGAVLPGLGIWLAGEVAERYLFFRAVDAPRMPGLPAA